MQKDFTKHYGLSLANMIKILNRIQTIKDRVNREATIDWARNTLEEIPPKYVKSKVDKSKMRAFGDLLLEFRP